MFSGACRLLISYVRHQKQPLDVFNIATAAPDECLGDAQHAAECAVAPAKSALRLSSLALPVANPYPRLETTPLTRTKIDAQAAPREGATVAEGWQTPSFREGLAPLWSAKG